LFVANHHPAIPIFGTALEELGEVPELVGQILEILEKEGACLVAGECSIDGGKQFTDTHTEHCKVEGIFRLNGAADVIDAIAALYNRGGRSNDLHTKGAYTLAGLLNKYLLDLPDPPIPRSFRRAFLEAASTSRCRGVCVKTKTSAQTCSSCAV